MVKGDMTVGEYAAISGFVKEAVPSYWPQLQKRLIAAGWRYRG